MFLLENFDSNVKFWRMKILVRVYDDRQSRKYEAPETYNPEYNIAGKILPLHKILVREYKAGQSGKL